MSAMEVTKVRIPEEIEPAIKKIDERITELSDMRAKLLELFNVTTPVIAVTRRVQSTANYTGVPNRATQMAEWLKVNGPATRQEIIRGLGIPEGTVSFTLKRNRLFKQLLDGKWVAAQADQDSKEATEAAS